MPDSNVQNEIRISELPAATQANGDDQIEANQNGVTRRVTVGQIANQLAVQIDLTTYARINSPVFTGNPQAPTPVTSDNDTSVATTAFVQSVIASAVGGPAGGDLAGAYPNPTIKANVALTGNPTAPTPSPGDNDTSIATTAFVAAAVAATAPPTTSAGLAAQITDETGTGALVFQNGALGNASATTIQMADGTVALPSLTFSGDTGTGLRRTTNLMSLSVAGKEALRLNASGASNNYVSVTSNNTPTISAVEGAAGNIVLQLQGAGTSGVDLRGNGNYVIRGVPSGGTIANYLTVSSSTAGNPVVVQAQGSDTDIDLSVQGKGLGVVRFPNAGSFVANGAVATTMTSLGPTGASTTVRKWMKIRDDTGTIGYIPVY